MCRFFELAAPAHRMRFIMMRNTTGRYRRFSIFSVLLLLCALASSLHAQTLVLKQQSWAHDPSASLSFQEAQQLPQTPFEGVLSRGFGSGAVWIRLQLGHDSNSASQTGPGEPPILVIRPAYLDDIRVYDALQPQGDAPLSVAGDQHHPKDDAIRSTDFIVPIVSSAEPRDVWLRLTSTSTRQIAVEVTTLSALQATRLKYQVLTALCIAIIAILFVWSGTQALLLRDTLLGAFAFKQIGALLISLTAFGYARVYWPGFWSAAALDQLGSFASIFSVVGALLFHIRLLKDYDLPKASWLVLLGLFAISLFNMGLFLVGQTRAGLTSNMYLALVAPVLFLCCAMTARIWKRDPKHIPLSVLPRWVILSLYVTIVIVLGASSSAALAFSQGYVWTLYMGLIHGLLTGLLIMLMLQFRNYRMAQEQQASTLLLQRRTLEAQYHQQRRKEQEQLLHMLAHEIKTPLATIQLRLDSHTNPDIPIVLRQLNSVIDRCLQAQQTDEDSLLLNRQDTDVAELLHDAKQSCPCSKRVDLHIDPLPLIHTDRQLLFIVLSNLLDNACKYSPPETIIHVKASFDAHTDTMHFTISNAPGQAGWPDPDKLFDKFYRAPHAQRQAGTGLGLYIVSNVMEKLGGSVAYTPSENRLMFTVTLQAARPPSNV